MKRKPIRVHVLRIILCVAVIAGAIFRGSFLTLDTLLRRIAAAAIALVLAVISIRMIYISIAGIMDNCNRSSHNTP